MSITKEQRLLISQYKAVMAPLAVPGHALLSMYQCPPLLYEGRELQDAQLQPCHIPTLVAHIANLENRASRLLIAADLRSQEAALRINEDAQHQYARRMFDYYGQHTSAMHAHYIELLKALRRLANIKQKQTPAVKKGRGDIAKLLQAPRPKVAKPANKHNFTVEDEFLFDIPYTVQEFVDMLTTRLNEPSFIRQLHHATPELSCMFALHAHRHITEYISTNVQDLNTNFHDTSDNRQALWSMTQNFILYVAAKLSDEEDTFTAKLATSTWGPLLRQTLSAHPGSTIPRRFYLAACTLFDEMIEQYLSDVHSRATGLAKAHQRGRLNKTDPAYGMYVAINQVALQQYLPLPNILAMNLVEAHPHITLPVANVDINIDDAYKYSVAGFNIQLLLCTSSTTYPLALVTELLAHIAAANPHINAGIDNYKMLSVLQPVEKLMLMLYIDVDNGKELMLGSVTEISDHFGLDTKTATMRGTDYTCDTIDMIQRSGRADDVVRSLVGISADDPEAVDRLKAMMAKASHGERLRMASMAAKMLK